MRWDVWYMVHELGDDETGKWEEASTHKHGSKGSSHGIQTTTPSIILPPSSHLTMIILTIVRHGESTGKLILFATIRWLLLCWENQLNLKPLPASSLPPLSRTPCQWYAGLSKQTTWKHYGQDGQMLLSHNMEWTYVIPPAPSNLVVSESRYWLPFSWLMVNSVSNLLVS